MRIGIPAEVLPGEKRVAATAETVKILIAQGHTVVVEKEAGAHANQRDKDYSAVGATITDSGSVFSADMILKVRAALPSELAQIKPSSVLVGMLDPFDQNNVLHMAQAGITAFALESAPRTSRAQSLDVLSSQANIAGYKAVIVAANFYQRLIPMLMTAAGTIRAAKVLILGAGVAGLQAIATAKRLGAIVEASDVRPATQEQVESLGAKFIDVAYLTEEERQIARGEGGYARPMPSTWLERQYAIVSERAQQADIIITTALIPGREAPTLLTEEVVKAMKPGSVIVDMAAGKGANGSGNCSITQADQVVEKYGVTIIGYTNLPSMASADASALYARNMLAFIKLIVNAEGQLAINIEDDIVRACMLCHDKQTLQSIKT